MKLPEIKLSFKIDKVKKSELTQVTSSQEGYEVLKQIFNADTIDWVEEAIVLCMNRANKVIAYYKLASGGMSGVVVDPKVVFTVALQSGASAVILAHNHPSGNMNPSKQDELITQKIKTVGEALDMPLMDHIIVTDESYYSFADNGKL